MILVSAKTKAHEAHISEIDVHLYGLDAITGLQLSVIEEHLQSCRHCQSRATEGLRRARETMWPQGDHVSTETLQYYHLGYLKVQSNAKD